MQIATELVAGAEGFEPPLVVLETTALPLNYAPVSYPRLKLLGFLSFDGNFSM